MKSKVFGKENWTRRGTKNEKGTGFGLTLTRDFIVRMNGEIWFESKHELGTTFFILLPKS